MSHWALAIFFFFNYFYLFDEKKNQQKILVRSSVTVACLAWRSCREAWDLLASTLGEIAVLDKNNTDHPQTEMRWRSNKLLFTLHTGSSGDAKLDLR